MLPVNPGPTVDVQGFAVFWNACHCKNSRSLVGLDWIFYHKWISPTCTGETSEPSFVLQNQPIFYLERDFRSSKYKVFSPSHCKHRTLSDTRPRDIFLEKRVWRVWCAFMVTLDDLYILKGIVLGRGSDIRNQQSKFSRCFPVVTVVVVEDVTHLYSCVLTCGILHQL